MAGVVVAARLLRVLLRLFVRRFLGIGSQYSVKCVACESISHTPAAYRGAWHARTWYSACMTVMILGAQGFLGRQFTALYDGAVTPSVDIADAHAVATLLDDVRPDILINAAGKTGRPNVDWCEEHKAETLRSNVIGPMVLATAAAERDIYMVHLGSGCIYSGDNDGQGWEEHHTPNFRGSFYSRSKILAEEALRDFPVLQLRLRMPFGDVHDDRDLLTKLSRFSALNAIENSVTYLPDFLAAAAMLIEQRRTGVYNIVNPGTISPYRIMELYAETVDPQHAFRALSAEELLKASKAPRSNCMLSITLLEKEGIRMLPVEEAVRTAWTRRNA